jgi:hypothetical protein
MVSSDVHTAPTLKDVSTPQHVIGLRSGVTKCTQLDLAITSLPPSQFLYVRIPATMTNAFQLSPEPIRVVVVLWNG